MSLLASTRRNRFWFKRLRLLMEWFCRGGGELTIGCRCCCSLPVCLKPNFNSLVLVTATCVSWGKDIFGPPPPPTRLSDHNIPGSIHRLFRFLLLLIMLHHHQQHEVVRYSRVFLNKEVGSLPTIPQDRTVRRSPVSTTFFRGRCWINFRPRCGCGCCCYWLCYYYDPKKTKN